MPIATRLIISLLLLATLFGCTPAALQSVPVAHIVQSSHSRDTAPLTSSDELHSLVAGNTEFALALYHALSDGERSGNLFFSPYSISMALAMTYAGARGETAQQMSQALRYLLAQERLHPAFNALDLELARRAQESFGGESDPFRLDVANAIWGRKDYAFLPAYLDTLATNYAAGMRLLDFGANPESCRKTINDWVKANTGERIAELLAQGAIDAQTALVLTNAIYFHAKWMLPFNEKNTQDGTFHTADGREVLVPFMRSTNSYAYAEGDGYQAIELPYLGNKLAMDVLLPADGRWAEFEATLDAARLEAILGDLDHGPVALSLPRFEFDSSFDLSRALVDMGMPLAFSSSADFSGMSGNGDLFITSVVHQAFVAVDEKGTEAAAATAVVMAGSARPSEPLSLVVDRPFLFVIRDLPTGAILFVGRVTNPANV